MYILIYNMLLLITYNLDFDLGKFKNAYQLLGKYQE